MAAAEHLQGAEENGPGNPWLPQPPSKTTNRFWIQEWAPQGERQVGRRPGKWVVTVDARELDAAWDAVRDALHQGQLGPAAKCRTARSHPFFDPSEKTVICVYTRDSEDPADRERVRVSLEALGFRDLHYKTDEETRQDWATWVRSVTGTQPSRPTEQHRPDREED